jgi:hypothetical protein
MVIVGALAVSGGVVAGAQYYVSSQNTPSTLTSADVSAQNDAWAESLAEIQAQSGIALPDAPPEDAVANLLSQAQSNNLTDSIGRSLLVRLTSAGVQGLGDDIPTQESIIAEAMAKINSSPTKNRSISLNLVESTELSLRSYGNGAMAIFAAHPQASSEATLLTIAEATDVQNPAPLAKLAPIGRQYEAIAEELEALTVPKTIEPLHVQAVRNLYAIADTYPDLAQVVADPLRGVAAVQKYQLLMGETGRILTNIADTLKKGGILFSKDEPGAGWDIFLSTP